MTETSRSLVVEDNSSIRALLAVSLDDAGFQVQTAANGREALAVLQRWHPDVITLDLEMPVMNGWTFSGALHRASDLADIPVIVVSGVPDLEEQVCMLGAAASVSKPYDLDALPAIVRRVLERRHREAGIR